jgi:hypothetical protein
MSMMTKSAILAGTLAMVVLGTAEAQQVPSGDQNDGNTVEKAVLAQNGGGDSAGRGPDTSKGAVPKNPAPYPSGITQPGTAPVPPSPPDARRSPTTPGTTVAPGQSDTPTGTGLRSPGTTQQGGDTRTDR